MRAGCKIGGQAKHTLVRLLIAPASALRKHRRSAVGETFAVSVRSSPSTRMSVRLSTEFVPGTVYVVCPRVCLRVCVGDAVHVSMYFSLYVFVASSRLGGDAVAALKQKI